LKILFICSRNRRRSPTAESLFSRHPTIEAASAGTSPDADTPLSADLIEWADIIYVMENIHRRRVSEKFRSLLKTRKITVLGITDKYDYLDPDLVKLLRTKLAHHLSVSV